MKKIIKILFVLSVILISNKIKAQIDTLNYLKQFEAQKANYIGKPMSILLNDMVNIQLKSNFSDSSFRNKNVRINTRFKLVSMDHITAHDITLMIYWQDPIPTSDTKYYENKNQCNFTSDEKTFYGSKIIKDIKVYR